mgnify:CR=1 FL=1
MTFADSYLGRLRAALGLFERTNPVPLEGPTSAHWQRNCETGVFHVV